MENLSNYRLTILPEKDGYDPADSMPKYGLRHDARYFDLESLVRMYGREEVRNLLEDSKENK